MGSLEVKNSNILKFPKPLVKLDQRGIGCVFHDLLLSNKEKLAQIYGPTGERDTYGEVLKRSIRVAVAMRTMGIKPGDFVSLCTYNHLDSCTPLIASFFIGAIVAAVDPTLSLDETVQLLKQTPPKVIFAHSEAVPMIEKSVEAIGSDTKVVVYGKTTKHIPFADLLQETEEETDFKPVEVGSLKGTAVIFFSSGTTGLPKGVCITHQSLVCGTIRVAKPAFNVDLVLSFASPYWTVFLSTLSSALVYGGARLVYPKFDPEKAWQLFSYKVTTVFLNTIQILTMLGQDKPKILDLGSVEDILLGGASLMIDQILKARATFPDARVHQTYGLTEIWGLVTIFRPIVPKDLEFISKKPSSVGTGTPGKSYKIVDPDTEEILGPNQQGELRIKTDMQMGGYYNVDSSEAWDSDGWMKTGDVAYYDEDHCFYIVDRIKEMFKYQCWHIAPALIENILLSHPAVEIATVIGIPHETDGYHPMGVVKLKSSQQKVAPAEIIKFVEERAQDRQKLRAGLKIVEKFPITASGKVNRTKLKKMALDGEI